MNLKYIPFLLGVALAVLKYKKFIAISNWYIFLCFFVWFIMFYWSVHLKNKDRNIPRPVYYANDY